MVPPSKRSAIRPCLSTSTTTGWYGTRQAAQVRPEDPDWPGLGDFAGPKAIRAIALYLTSAGATVNTFYLSNVEQYLFQGTDAWRRFYDNVGTMPLDPTLN